MQFDSKSISLTAAARQTEMHWCGYGGQSKQARDANSWIYVPAGTCAKIAGDSLKRA